MTAVLDRVPVGRISERASSVKFSRVLAAVVGGVFFALGWLAYKPFAVAWYAAVWLSMAVAEGWSSARAAETRKRQLRYPRGTA